MAVYSKNSFVRWGKRARNCLRKAAFKKMSLNRETLPQVLFISFGGRQYSDNPKAISDRLHEIAPDLRQVWLFNESADLSDELPDWIVPVLNTKENCDRALAESAVWVSNFEMPSYVTKKNDQLYFQTYHGDRAFKKVLYEATPVRDLRLMEEEDCDYLVTGSKFAENWMPKSFKSSATLLKVGCPRNDVLFNVSTERRLEILGTLGLKDDANVLLYAPTFRDWLDEPQETYGIDLGRLLDRLTARDNKEWICLVRKHPSSKGISYDCDDARIYDASDYPYSDDLLCVADFLLTDYSSIVNDFILRRKPAVLCTADLAEYLSYRPLLLDFDSCPYPCANSADELEEIVDGMGDDYGEREYEKVAAWYGIYEDGTASEKIASMIKDFITRH